MEIARMLADPESSVKGYAAEKLGEVGEEAIAVQSLSREAQNFEKALALEKPEKPDEKSELAKWEEQERVLNSLYAGLAKTKSALAVAPLEKALRHSNPWVVRLAAENCHGFAGNRAIMKALVDGLAKYYAAVVTKGNSAAWTAISMAMPLVSGCNDIPTQKDGGDAGRWNSDWQKWWRANEKKLK